MRTKEMEKIDVKKYIGRKVLIEKAEVVETKHGMCLKLESEVLEELKDDKFLRASLMLSFMKDDNGLFVGEETRLDNFLKAKGVDPAVIPENVPAGVHIAELVGKECVVQLNTKTNYLDLI